MSYLIVVAHPDDEVLGAGGTIYKLSKSGKKVDVCILSSQAQARTSRPGDEELYQDMQRSMDRLGIQKRIYGTFPNIQFNTIPHLELVQFIENALIETGADVIFTHHPSDLNNDHVHTSLACQAAVRLFQRREGMTPLRELLFMEVLSSTEWAFNSGGNRFAPNTFVELGSECLMRKLEALSLYRGVMRKYPHPRSEEAIKGLSAYRGGQSGFEYAEAFENVFRRI